MLNPLPQLLTYAFFAPTLIRITVALVLLFVVWRMHETKSAILATTLPIVGKPAEWMLLLSMAIMILTSAALFFGYYTQIAALAGMVLALKHGLFAKRYPTVIPLSRTAYLLVFVICLSLLLSGAGALAYDLPL